MLHQCKRADTNTYMYRINGPSTRPNSSAGWKYHGSRVCKKNHQTKMSKAIDMRLYWIQDRKDQGQFTIYWSPGKKNLSDYHSKNPPPYHHIVMRPTILYSLHYVNYLTQCIMRWCVNPPKLLAKYAHKYARIPSWLLARLQYYETMTSNCAHTTNF